MFVEPSTSVSWLSYALDHVHLAFWAAALGFVWRFRHAVDKWADSLTMVESKTVAVEKMVMEIHGTTAQIRDNDLHHLTEKVEDQKVILDKTLDVLQSIDKNTAVMAERMTRRRNEP